MLKTKMERIRDDYQVSLIRLQERRHESETREKQRIDEIKQYRIQKMIDHEKTENTNRAIIDAGKVPDDQTPTTSKQNDEETNESTENQNSSSSEDDETISAPNTKIIVQKDTNSISPSTEESDGEE